MATQCEMVSAPDGRQPEWHVYHGAGVRLALPHESPTLPPNELQTAEALVVEICRLIKPESQAAPPDLHIYTMDSQEPGSTQGPEFSALSQSLEDGSESASPDEIIRIEVSIPSVAGFALTIARKLIEHWYGPNAASDDLFAAGIAGLAAANSETGPTVADADHRVQSELRAGRRVSMFAGNRARQTDEVDYAATSFVAHLASESSGIRRYLANYDPKRQDQAAQLAFHHPLAVLEEEWIERLRARMRSPGALRRFLQQVMPLLAPYRWRQLEILCYLLLAAAYNVVLPYAVKVFIDKVTFALRGHTGAATGASFARQFAPFLIALLGIYVINGVVSLRRAYTVNWLNQNVLNRLQIRMYSHLQRLTHSYYVSARIGDLMARINDDLDYVQSALSQVTNKALYQGFTIAGALAALFILTRKSPQLGVMIILIIPLFAANYVALRTRNKQASREQRKRVSQSVTAIHQDLTAHAVIKAFGLEPQKLNDYKTTIFALQKSKLRLALLSAITDLSEDMTTALAQLIIFGVGGYLVIRNGGHGMGVGDLSALLVLVKSIFSPIASLSGIGQTLQQATGAMERVSELLNEPVAIADKPDAATLPDLDRDIRFEDVTFRYDGGRPALANVTLAIPARKHVAVVGPSGAGKSTLASLLLRFWDPQSGSILFDGKDLRDVTLRSLRTQIGLVFQETYIFDTTLRANIAIGRPVATDAEIVAAAKAAQIDRFIESLPAGYNTIPGENGARLSVGQKQRIAIARVFLRNPPILILDEATSALDASKEGELLDTLAELATGRTTISITHRISQAAAADRIFVLDAGELVEQGTHAELVAANGLYRRLYDGSAIPASPAEDIREPRPQCEAEHALSLAGSAT